MNFLGRVVQWFLDPVHWQGTGGILNRLLEHVEMSVIATAVACAIALPIGLALGHGRRFGGLAINISNVGRALPSFAILVLALMIFGIGATPAFVALVLLAIPPVLTNAYVGMTGVDAELSEAARGLGMRPLQVLLRVELPVAMPVVMAGVRTAGVQVVATATLAALVAWGGLGRFIVDGFGQRDDVQIFAGALLVAALAFAAELALAGLQVALTPRGVRGATVVRRAEDLAAGVARLEPAT